MYNEYCELKNESKEYCSYKKDMFKADLDKLFDIFKLLVKMLIEEKAKHHFKRKSICFESKFPNPTNYFEMMLLNLH